MTLIIRSDVSDINHTVYFIIKAYTVHATVGNKWYTKFLLTLKLQTFVIFLVSF